MSRGECRESSSTSALALLPSRLQQLSPSPTSTMQRSAAPAAPAAPAAASSSYELDPDRATHVNAHSAGMAKYLTHFHYPAPGADGQRILSPMDTCVFRGAIGGVFGGAMGVVIGSLMHMSGPASGLGSGMGPMGAAGMPGMPNPNAVHTPPPPPPSAASTAATVRNAPGAMMAGASASAASTAASSSSAIAAPASASSALSGSSSFRPVPLAGIGPAPRPIPFAPALGVADPIYGFNTAPEPTTWAQVKTGFRDFGRMSKGQFKTWGAMSGTYATSECVVEKMRGKSDELNPLIAGCAAGGILAARAGPQGMAIGCAGFAAFSFAIEKAMHSFGS